MPQPAHRSEVVDFLIIGAARSGTTALWDYLGEHPGVLQCRNKEPNYFTNRWHRNDWSWYASRFPNAPHRFFRRMANRGRRPLLGEASTYYLFYPYTASRVGEALPRARVIVLLRNPIDRAYSHHAQNTQRGFETLSFEDAIEAEEDRLRDELPRLSEDETYDSDALHRASYATRGRYLDQLQPWFEHFPGDQIHVVSSEEFFRDTDRVFNEILNFLGLAPRHRSSYAVRNRVPYSPMADSIRERLRAYFKPHNERLYAFLGRDFGWD